MAHHNTILRQIVAFLPRHEFDALTKKHHHGQNFRSFNRWSQFMAMCTRHVPYPSYSGRTHQYRNICVHGPELPGNGQTPGQESQHAFPGTAPQLQVCKKRLLCAERRAACPEKAKESKALPLYLKFRACC